ncbi:MAG: hypothetical protein ACR2QM_11180, partial [Longimicrobiales bacterium]
MYRRARLGIMLIALALLAVQTACDDDLGDNVRNTDFFAEETFSFEVAVVQQEAFEVAGINGQINVVGVPGRTSIEIEGTRRVESESVADAEANLERLQVVLTEQTDFVRVHTDQPDQPRGRVFIVDYVVTVPDGLEVDIDNINGRIVLEAIEGLADVQNVNGVVQLIELRGNTTVGVV